jgi:hypothetical protein
MTTSADDAARLLAELEEENKEENEATGTDLRFVPVAVPVPGAISIEEARRLEEELKNEEKGYSYAAATNPVRSFHESIPSLLLHSQLM